MTTLTFRMCRVCNSTYALPSQQTVCGWCERAYRQALADAADAVKALRGSECDKDNHAEDNGPGGGWGCCMDFDAAIAAIEALGGQQ